MATPTREIDDIVSAARRSHDAEQAGACGTAAYASRASRSATGFVAQRVLLYRHAEIFSPLFT